MPYPVLPDTMFRDSDELPPSVFDEDSMTIPRELAIAFVPAAFKPITFPATAFDPAVR